MSIVDRIDPAFGHWFAGFVDGEGCFYIRRSKVTYGGDHYVSYGCSLTLGVRADELPTLTMIRETLGVGVISSFTPTGGKQSPVVTLSIHNKDTVLMLVELFDRFPLRAKKSKDFAVWRRAVVEWHREKGRRGSPRDWTRMAELHAELKAVRRYTEIA